MSTFDKVKEVIIDKLGVEEDKIESNSSLGIIRNPRIKLPL